MKNNFDTIIFACDCNDFSGEGILANRFINDYKNIKNNEKIYVYSFENIFFLKNNNKSFLRLNYKKKIKNNLIFKYLRPIMGIFILWFYFFKNKKNNLFKLFTVVECFIIHVFTSQNNFRSDYRIL
jgi:hypothetical protein